MVSETSWIQIDFETELFKNCLSAAKQHRSIAHSGRWKTNNLTLEHDRIADFANFVPKELREFGRRLHHGVVKDQRGAHLVALVAADLQVAHRGGAAQLVHRGEGVDSGVRLLSIWDHQSVFIVKVADLM